MLRRERDHDGGKLRALGFVDGYGVSECYFVQLAKIVNHLPLIELHRDLALDQVDLRNLPNVAVEHVLVVVVLRLDDLVPDPEPPAELLHDWFLGPGRIQLGLESRVQLADAERATVHRAEHLDVTDGFQQSLLAAMPSWLSIALAVGCWLAALQQVRMYFIYAGRIYSPTIGAVEGGPTLRAVAIRSAITFIIYGFIVLLVPWPRLLTYVSAVWLCRAAIDTVFGWFGMGVNGVTVAVSTEKGRRHYLVSQAVAVFSRAIVVAVCGYFLDFDI